MRSQVHLESYYYGDYCGIIWVNWWLCLHDTFLINLGAVKEASFNNIFNFGSHNMIHSLWKLILGSALAAVE